MSPRLLLIAVVSAAVLVISIPAEAGAADAVGPQYIQPSSQVVAPPTFLLSAKQAEAVAARVPQVRSATASHPGLYPVAYIRGPRLWEVDWYSIPAHRAATFKPVDQVEVDLDGRTGRVLQVFTGIQTTDFLARGHFGRLADSPWVWVVLCLIFVAPFVDPRRPFRLLHLDLLALLAFGISHLFFTQQQISASVPLVYPVLIYLLVRMLIAGFRPRRRPEQLVPLIPIKVMSVAVFVLIALRAAINLFTDKVIDVGYASVVGAFRVMHHLPLYVVSQFHGDTYGPLNYVAYVPFEHFFPWTGRWDHVLAAHAAALCFDSLTILGLFLLGGRMRSGAAGRKLGVALAFAWAAYPYTLYPLALNTNDALISMLLVYALVAIASPARRSAMVALAGAAKFGPLALAPLFAGGLGERRLRSSLIAAGVTGAIVVVSLIAYLPQGGLPVFWESTLGFQLVRPSNFSIWAQHPSLAPLQTAVELGAVALALLVAFFPRRRDLSQVAALGGAVLIATQLPVKHWFYFYIAWFAPFVFAALFGQYRTERVAAHPQEIETATVLPAEQAAHSSG